jgi:DNA-directed RNA polymerase I subunit RPA1
VFQSEGKKDPFIEELTNMALPENPFNDAKKCIQLDNQICAALEDKIGQSLNNKEALEVELDNVIKGVMSKATSEVLKGCIPSGLIKRFPRNNISAMVLTGAKGGVVNQTQISALLGQ